jgi:hypothetical protein
MDLEDGLAPGLAMQSVHILRDQGEGRGAALQFSERIVSRVGFYFGQQATAPVIPFPAELRVTRKCFGRRQVLCAKLLPQPAGATKGGNAAFGGDTGAGEDGNAARLMEQATRTRKRVAGREHRCQSRMQPSKRGGLEAF